MMPDPEKTHEAPEGYVSRAEVEAVMKMLVKLLVQFISEEKRDEFRAAVRKILAEAEKPATEGE